MTTRKFYRTTISIDVLSEEPLGDCLSLAQIDYAISEGDCVGGDMRAKARVLTAKETADALHDFGSDPSFFQLDNNGKTVREL